MKAEIISNIINAHFCGKIAHFGLYSKESLKTTNLMFFCSNWILIHLQDFWNNFSYKIFHSATRVLVQMARHVVGPERPRDWRKIRLEGHRSCGNIHRLVERYIPEAFFLSFLILRSRRFKTTKCLNLIHIIIKS